MEGGKAGARLKASSERRRRRPPRRRRRQRRHQNPRIHAISLVYVYNYFTTKWSRSILRMKAVIFTHVLYLILIRTFMVKGDTKCDSNIELRAVLLSCPPKDTGCEDDDPLSQAMNAEETQIVGANSRSFQTTNRGKDKGFPNAVKDCKRKIIITVKIKNSGQIACGDEYIIVDHVFDPLTRGKARLLSPVILKLRREQMIQLYGLQFERVVNSDPYEEQKQPSKVCSVAANDPTCGKALYDGKPIPFSEGFCCSCDPFVNAQRQLSPASRGDSFLYGDSKLISQDVGRFGRDEKSSTTIVDPNLVKMNSEKESEDGSSPTAKNKPVVKELQLDKIPNYMIEKDRKIICDREDFMNELCKMGEEKHMLQTEEPATLGDSDASAVRSDVAGGVKNGGGMREGTNAPAYDPPEFTTVPNRAKLPDDDSRNEIALEHLLAALSMNRADQTTESGQQIKTLSEGYLQPKSNGVFRGKRENRQEPAISRSGKKLTLEEKLQRFAKLKKGLSNRRKRLLELSRERFRKAEIRCRDAKDCQTVMVTDFPQDDYVRAPPPKFFFSHDKFIVSPMEPSQLISDSTCKSSGDVDYEEGVAPNREKHPSVGDGKETRGGKERSSGVDSYRHVKFQKGESKLKTKEKYHKLNNKKERVTHNIGGKIENNMLRDKMKLEELEMPPREESPKSGKRLKEGEEVGETEKSSRNDQEEETAEETGRKNYKSQKMHFGPKSLKNLLLKSDERKGTRSKIRNFIMAKSREKQKLKSGFVTSGKKPEAIAKEDEKKEFQGKKWEDACDEAPKKYKEQEPPEDRKFGDEEANDKTREKSGEENGPENPARDSDMMKETKMGEKSAEENDVKNMRSNWEGKPKPKGNKGPPLLPSDENNERAVDFRFEIIRKHSPDLEDVRVGPSKEEPFQKNRVSASSNRVYMTNIGGSRKSLHPNQFRQNQAFHYKERPRYYVIQKTKQSYPENMFFVDDRSSPVVEPKPKVSGQANGRTAVRPQSKHDLRYFDTPVKQYYLTDHLNRNPNVGFQKLRQSFSAVHDDGTPHKAQIREINPREVFLRQVERFPEKTSSRARQDDQDLQDSTLEKVRSKRTAGYSFEPARGFLRAQLEFSHGGDGESKQKDEEVADKTHGCPSEGKEKREGGTEDWAENVAGWRFSRTEPYNLSLRAEIISGVQGNYRASTSETEARGRKGASDKERLIRSYLNAPDYVLEEMREGMKGKRQATDPNDQSNRDATKGIGHCGGDTYAGEYTQDTAHCMRFGDLWYSLYVIKKPVVAQIVGVQLFDKHLLSDGTTQWRDLTKGQMVRVGTFLPRAEDEIPTISMTYMGGKTSKMESTIDPDNYMLLIPSHISNPSKANSYPQLEGGPAEYLVVNSKEVSSGGECNRVGTSFEAFARQPDRCSQRKGNCLKRQPVDLWREDMEARIRGKRGKYFVENFGTVSNSAIKTYTNFSGEYLALEYYGEYTSTLEIEVRADYNAIVRKGSNAQIPTVYIDGTYHKKTRIILSVLNIGLTSSYFRPRLGDCSPDINPAWCPLEGPLVTIPPQQRHDFKLDLSGVLPSKKIHATVQVLNQLNKKIAHRKIVIKKGERCVCAFHCKCNCIGNLGDGRTCHKLTRKEYKEAGYMGAFPFRAQAGGSTSEKFLGNTRIVLLTASYVLLFLGVLKASLGSFFRRIGIAGTRVIVGPRKLCRYYESELECCTVLYDECGFPVHPATYQPVQIIPLWLEIIINIFFFFLYTIRGIGFLIIALPCCKTICADCDGCMQQDEEGGFDQKCSSPLLSKNHHQTCANYNLTAISTKKVKADQHLLHLPYKGDDDPLEDDDTEFVLQEMKRYRQK